MSSAQIFLNKFSIVIFTFAVFSNAFTLEFVSGFSDRTAFKAISVLLLFFAFFVRVFIKMSLSKKDLVLLATINFFFFILFLSDFINNGFLSIDSLLRFISTVIFCMYLFSLQKNELAFSLKLSISLLVMIAVISVAMLVINFNGGEKFPLIDLHSNKSIIFEQNIFGISMYFLFLFLWKFSTNFNLAYIVSAIALFASFYRTVFVLFIARLLFNKYIAAIFLSALLFSIYFYFQEISEILKLDQIYNLTGRTDLWAIGFDGFATSPYFGLGESMIAEYSNNYLNRARPYTTFHNSIIDILFSAGAIGLISFLMLLFFSLRLAGRESSLFIIFMFLPSLFNSYYFFSFNILGGISALAIVFLYRERKLVT